MRRLCKECLKRGFHKMGCSRQPFNMYPIPRIERGKAPANMNPDRYKSLIETGLSHPEGYRSDGMIGPPTN